MEEENKYYTPEIEEFHVGFNYQFKTYIAGNINNPEWITTTWGANSTFSDQGFNIIDIRDNHIVVVEAKDIRVKHLDREDIEDCGFKSIGTTIDDWYELKISRPGIMTAHTNRRFVLRHDFRTNQGVVIDAYDYESGDSGENTIHRGTCKNKSEFKKLLIKIGITNN